MADSVLFEDSFIIILAVVEEYLTDTNSYRAHPFNRTRNLIQTYILQSVDASNMITGYPNTTGTPQTVRLYKPGTAVLACVPKDISHTPYSESLGFIIGEIGSEPMASLAAQSAKVSEGLNGVLRQINETHQLIPNSMSSNPLFYNYKGKLGDSDIPGDVMTVGKRTKMVQDDYTIHLEAGACCYHCSSLTGTVTERYVFKDTATALTKSRTYITDGKTLTINKHSYNVYKSYFDAYDVREGELQDNGKPRLYDVVEHVGDAVGGYYKTQFITLNSKDVPVYQERVDLEGNVTISSSKAITLKKTQNFDAITFDDNSPIISKELPQVTEAEHHKSELSDVRQPGLLPDVAFDQISDDAKMYKAEGAIQFMDDGSIKIQDAWGSYILMSHGNIQICAANDIVQKATKSAAIVTGGALNIASCSVIDISAEKGVRLNANTLDVLSSDCILNSDTLCVQSTAISVKAKSSGITSEFIQVGTPSTILDVTANTCQMSLNTYTLLTQGACIAFNSKTLTVMSNINVGGTLYVSSESVSIPLLNGSVRNISSAGSDIIVKDGSVTVARAVECSDVLSSGIQCSTLGVVNATSDGRISKINSLETTLNRIKTAVKKQPSLTYNISEVKREYLDALTTVVPSVSIDTSDIIVYLKQNDDPASGDSLKSTLNKVERFACSVTSLTSDCKFNVPTYTITRKD